MPEEEPEVRNRFIDNQNVYKTINFQNYGDRLPNSSYKDYFGSMN
jgi:hypothetical protein